MCAMPSASDGAPPVRQYNHLSPTSCASASISAADTGKPQAEIVETAASGVVPTTPAGEFTAKNTPGCSEHAAISAITATNPSSSIDPYPTGHAFHSRAIIFGVVPDEIRE